MENKFWKFFKKDTDDDDDIEMWGEIEEREEDDPYQFPISKKQAFQIANENCNLKTDFCRNAGVHGISYLYFDHKKIDKVKINGRTFWQIQIKSGDISGIEDDGEGTYCWDGSIGKDDLKFLRCLVDVETGEYIYYPKNQKDRFGRKFFEK